MNITLVPVGDVDQVWPMVTEGLQRACMVCGGDIVAGDLWLQCRAGNAFLIVAHEDEEILGASVWGLERWATGQKLRCMALYSNGNLLKWVSLLRATVIELMKNCGAHSIVLEGLEKWSPLFRRMCPKAKRLMVVYEERIDG